MYGLGVDLGTTYTAAAVWRGGTAEVIPLGDRAPVVPSVLLLRDDGGVLVGEPAVRRGLVEPLRVAREFKRRLGDPVPLLLAGRPLSPQALMARLLSWVVAQVTEREGAPPDRLVVTCPANWGPHRRELLDLAVGMADVGPAEVVTEPVAAAVHVASTQRFADGDRLAVYDLGGGTFDAAVLRKSGAAFELLGSPAGIEHLGGVDFDAAVYGHVARALGDDAARLEADDEATVAAVARLQRDCSEAKEALSADSETVIPVTLPDLVRPVRLTRGEFEELIRPALIDTVLCLRRAMASAGVEAGDLAAVVLAGGSSRIPLVAELLGTELGRPIAVTAYPKSSVALGAARLAGRDLPGEVAAAVPGRPRESPEPAGGRRGFRLFGRRDPKPEPLPVDLATLLTPGQDPGATTVLEPAPAAETTLMATGPDTRGPAGPVPDAPAPTRPVGGPVPGFHDATRVPGPPPPGPPPGTGPSRRPIWIAGGALLLVLVVIAAFSLLNRGGGDDDAGTSGSTTATRSTTAVTTTTTTSAAPVVVVPGTWTAGPPLPVPVEAAGAAVLDGKLWIAGGHSGDTAALDQVYVYDPAAKTERWTPGPDLPDALHDPALVSDGKRLYAIGGQRLDGTVERTTLVLTEDGKGWEKGTPLPDPRWAGSAVWDGSRILYAGGRDAKRDRAEIYALEDGVWRHLGDLHEPRNSMAAASDGTGTSWFLTGEQVRGKPAQQLAVGATDKVQGDTVTPGPDLRPRRAATGVYLPGYGPCLLGGVNGRTWAAPIECPEQPGYGDLPDGMTARAGLVAALLPDRLVTMGGFFPGFNSSRLVEILPLEQN